MNRFIFLFFIFFYLRICHSGNEIRRLDGNNPSSNQENTVDQKRVYFLKKVNGPGCPYTASWLIHIDLYRRVTWYLDITKMEAATFNM